MTELLDRVSPERKDVILARAEALVREERGRRGRSAPDLNQSSAAAPSPLARYLQGVALGCVAGFVVGYVLGIAVPRHDDCRLRANATHVSVCLDGPLAKAKELVR
ncbi:hypothetical protein [Bradyrhizobium sp. th.b2]|uniref:hypothetical protein n=1 Tax=Bradyrhizobium sp. th-b2 TaxID=172088 RepID=UPI00040331E4|nr:hypothetical protein [Bradyrhizobium sp. th.b2]